MSAITLTYINNSTGAEHTRTMKLFKQKGINRPEWTKSFPVLQFPHLNGLISQFFKGFRRRITVQLFPTNNDDDIIFVNEFMHSNIMSVTYEGKEVFVVRNDLTEHEGRWASEFKFCVSFTLELIESSILTTWAVAVRRNVVDSYLSIEFEITGTEESPQYFETGTTFGLINDATGIAFPEFDFDTHAIEVKPISRQPALVYRTKTALTDTDGKLGFWVARSNLGGSCSDGKYYAAFEIIRQAK